MDEVAELRKDIREVAGYVQTLAKHIMVKNGFEEEPSSDYPMDDMGEENGQLADDSLVPVDDSPIMDSPVEEPMLDDEENYDDFAAAYKAIKALETVKARQTRKGYAAISDVKRSEHDAPFGDKDSDLKGNEPQPRGDQGGDREDESFGPGGMAYRKMRSELSAMAAQLKELTTGTVVSKAVTPPSTGNLKVDGQPQGGTVTREMQEQAKGMTFKQINKIRTGMGDLPEFLF